MLRCTKRRLRLALALIAAASGTAGADTASPPAPAGATDPAAQLLQPCASGSDPAARAVACTNLIGSGKLSGHALGAAYVFRGRAQAERQELQAATDDFSSALKIEPGATDALYSRGVTYALLGRTDLALADFQRLLKIVPDDADTLFYRAQIYAQQGKYEAAVSDLGRVLTKVPDDFEVRMWRVGLSIMLGRNEDAIADCSRLLQQAPDAPAALYSRGRAEFLKGDFAAAAKDFSAAMLNRNSNPYAALRLFLANARRGKTDPAPLATAAKTFPAEQWPMPVVALYQGSITEQDLLAAAVAGEPKAAANLTAEAHYYLGALALAKDDTAGARAHFKAATATKADRGNLEFVDAGLELKRLTP